MRCACTARCVCHEGRGRRARSRQWGPHSRQREGGGGRGSGVGDRCDEGKEPQARRSLNPPMRRKRPRVRPPPTPRFSCDVRHAHRRGPQMARDLFVETGDLLDAESHDGNIGAQAHRAAQFPSPPSLNRSDESGTPLAQAVRGPAQAGQPPLAHLTVFPHYPLRPLRRALAPCDHFPGINKQFTGRLWHGPGECSSSLRVAR